MTLNHQDIAHLGDGEQETDSPDLFKHQQVRCKELVPDYLDFWPEGCEGAAQIPDWKLFQRKLDQLSKNRDRIRETWSIKIPARGYHISAKNREHTDNLVSRSGKPEQGPSASAPECKGVWMASAEESNASILASSPVGTDFDINGQDDHAGSHHEEPLLLVPPTDPVCDDSWAVANELHTARTSLCLEIDYNNDEQYDADKDESKSDEDSQSETHTVRVKEIPSKGDANLVVGDSNDETLSDEQAKALLMSNCALLIDLLQNDIAPSEELRKSTALLCERKWCSDSSRTATSCHSLEPDTVTNAEAHGLRKVDLLQSGQWAQRSPDTYRSRLNLEDCGSDYFSNEDGLRETENASSWQQSKLKKRVRFDSDAMQAPEDGPSDSLRNREMRGTEMQQTRKGKCEERHEAKTTEVLRLSRQQIVARIQKVAELQDSVGIEEANEFLEVMRVTNSGVVEDENNTEGNIWRQRCLQFNRAGHHVETQPAHRSQSVAEDSHAERRDAEDEAEEGCKEECEEESEKHPEIHNESRPVRVSTLLRRLSFRSRAG